jgi:hypothetical protein
LTLAPATGSKVVDEGPQVQLAVVAVR